MKNDANRKAAVAIAALTGLAAGASAQLTGTIKWTSSVAMTQPARKVTVELRTMTLAGPVTVATTSTDALGKYTFDAPGLPAGTPIWIRGVAKNFGGWVNSDGTLATLPYYKETLPAAYVPGGIVDLTVAGGDDAHHAFSVADAMYTGWHYAGIVRPGTTTALPARFPAATTNYTPPGGALPQGRLNLVNDDRWDWDVVNHEYAHYLSQLDGLVNTPFLGIEHAFGTSNIPAQGKLNGVRLGWQEGLPTYLSIAAQHVDKTGQNLPTTVPFVGDHYYTDTIDALWHVDLEGSFASSGGSVVSNVTAKGEGDELSVARILWDLADNPVGDDDPIGIGHGNLYTALDGMSNLDRLDDVWDHYYGISGDHSRSLFGRIFEEHEVSPSPNGAPINMSLLPTDPAPTFTWTRGNDGANDTFGLIVFDATMTSRLLDIAIAGDVTSYMLTAAQWAVLTAAAVAAGEPTLFGFIVWGRDAISAANVAYAADLVTGDYWSGSYQFTVIPTPGTAALLFAGGLWLVRIKRTRQSERALIGGQTQTTLRSP